MKRFLTLSTSLLIVLVGCSTPSAVAHETGNAKASVSADANVKTIGLFIGKPKAQGLVQQYAEEQQARYLKNLAHQMELLTNAGNLQKMVRVTKKYIGHTWYVPSGASPSGWDCSGLVRWAYAQIGVDLYHSASVQKNAGKIVKEPKFGDIVAFGWKGWNGAQHSGIYLGDGQMLHAGGHRGMRTEITNISGWAKGSGNTLVTYTRILDN
jgi:cell wall-associated NlpC family hydrolase